MGVTPGGRFDVSGSDARRMLTAVGNPNGCPNSHVVRPYWNGHDVTRRPRDRWIVDFGNHVTEAAAARYEAPFAHVEEVVKPARERSRTTRSEWWVFERPRPAMRKRWPRLVGTSRPRWLRSIGFLSGLIR